MNCEFCQQELSAYLDQELSQTVALQVQQHLAACSRCQAEYESLLKVETVLQEAEVFSPNPALWAGIEQRIATRRKINFLKIARSMFQDWIGHFIDSLPKPVLVGSLAIVLLLIGIFTLYRYYEYYEDQALLAWVEQNNTISVDLDANPFSLEVEENLDENPFASDNKASLDLHINSFNPLDSPEDEALEKNPFST